MCLTCQKIKSNSQYGICFLILYSVDVDFWAFFSVLYDILCGLCFLPCMFYCMLLSCCLLASWRNKGWWWWWLPQERSRRTNCSPRTGVRKLQCEQFQCSELKFSSVYVLWTRLKAMPHKRTFIRNELQLTRLWMRRLHSRVVVLGTCTGTWSVLKYHFQVLVLVLVLGTEVLVLVLETWVLVLVLVLETQVLVLVLVLEWLSTGYNSAAQSESVCDYCLSYYLHQCKTK